MEKEHASNQPGTDGLRDTGPGSRRTGTGRFYVSTQDLITMAILGVMGGFISGLIPFSLLVKTWYPFVGGTQLVSGHHFLWMAIAYGITRKKISIMITAFIKAMIMFLIGGEWGVVEIPISLYEGFFLMVGFWIVEMFKEGDTFTGWGIAAGLGNLSQVPLFWIMTGKVYILHASLFIMAMMFAFVSGVFIAGILGKTIVTRLKAAGVV